MNHLALFPKHCSGQKQALSIQRAFRFLDKAKRKLRPNTSPEMDLGELQDQPEIVIERLLKACGKLPGRAAGSFWKTSKILLGGPLGGPAMP